ncbi:glycosyltransferase family protein [Muricoccus pecuniae]|uniref:Glycosyl transferase family 2 n=1 Tax=Muricoccus pecuniae TaxID=693023 RepID=A0A840Y8N1_9PROT|nr:hypothetical protein [Roseomonas pecuniae]MBB5692281.1 hypothetical protein [Roseomonas pecuniae]
MERFDPYFFMLENEGERTWSNCAAAVEHRTPDFDVAHYQLARGKTFDSPENAYLDWLNVGRRLGLEYAAGRNTCLKIVLKAKDEPELFPQWFKHHSAIVGENNIIILDCGSEDPEYIEMLDGVRSRALVLSYPHYYDRIHSPNSNVEFFRLIEANCKYATILDADEFLIMYEGACLSTGRIASFLQSCEDDVHAGTWLFNQEPPSSTQESRIDWSVPISFDVGQGALRVGLNSGKSIVRSDKLFYVKHLGHNTARNALGLMTDQSVGAFFILHLKSLNPELRRRRLAQHLITRGVLSSGCNRHADVQKILEEKIQEGRLKGAELFYSKLYLAVRDSPAKPGGRGCLLNLEALSGSVCSTAFHDAIAGFDFSAYLATMKRRAAEQL